MFEFFNTWYVTLAAVCLASYLFFNVMYKITDKVEGKEAENQFTIVLISIISGSVVWLFLKVVVHKSYDFYTTIIVYLLFVSSIIYFVVSYTKKLKGIDVTKKEKPEIIKGIRCPYKDCNSNRAQAIKSSLKAGIYDSWITYCPDCRQESMSLSFGEIMRLKAGEPLI